LNTKNNNDDFLFRLNKFNTEIEGEGPKSREVRAFMRDSRSYELEYYGHNHSQGVLLPDRYKNSGDFIGPEEKSQYFQ
jgi:hypothetical protein